MQSRLCVAVVESFCSKSLLIGIWKLTRAWIGYARFVAGSWPPSGRSRVRKLVRSLTMVLNGLFTAHMTTHTGNKPYSCKLCRETFINHVVLQRHMRFHGVAPKVYRCEFCFKELATETSLKGHVLRLHRATVMCELCKAEFPTREQLRNHLVEAHQPSVCQICNKAFTLPRYLTMHQKIHFDDTSGRIQCEICLKVLGLKNIKHHVYRHHSDQFDTWQQLNPTL